MDVNKLNTFLDLTETLNYTETAARLFLSQATVSKQIIALEKEIGLQLFKRDHRQVTITAAGLKILPLVRELVANNAALMAELNVLKSQQSNTLTIRAIPSISQYRAFNILAAFTKAHPEIKLNFAEAESETLANSIAQRRTDIVFMRIFDVAKCPYDRLLGETDHFVALLPQQHRLATKKALTIADLREESFLQLDEATNLLDPVIKMMQTAGYQPNVTYKGKRVELILEMISRGMGVSILMSHSADLTDFPNIVAVPIAPAVNSVVAFVRPQQQNTPASDLFWQFCQQHGMR
ncbi:LysR family transcriptional regulator [Loigolactobacillus binensis]|uniref:LysR family transcriptional regulator n=1 Tax=Loigolactobacillus binensis TaxID=2559922 RepID=A0ABW3EAU4_9LACO|nr:LysR family transcriptional regulator [Loigolactobacillus binensis]